MRRPGLVFCTIAVTLATSCLILGLEATTLKPTHLKGLRGVNVIAYVSGDLPDGPMLEREILAQAREILARDGGILADSSRNSWLSIRVKNYPTKERLASEEFVVLVRVELREEVRLARDLSLRIPGHNGALTWSSEWVSIESKADVHAFVKREIESQVGSFAADVKYANSRK